MAAALINLSQNDRLRTDMGKRNRKTVENRFSIGSHTHAIESIYDRLTGGDRLVMK